MNGFRELEKALPDGDFQQKSDSVVFVEVCQNPSSTVAAAKIKECVTRFLFDIHHVFGDVTFNEFPDPFMAEHVIYIAITDTDLEKQALNFTTAKLSIHVFQLHEGGPASEDLDGEELAAANHWILPSAEMQGIWENLIFDGPIKLQLLNYATTTLLFSDSKVNPSIINWNRVVLLHGPPGTGKTSLCKALAQKLTIRLSDRYSYGQFIEINSHSLFSKWFSESGKLVMKMFQKIQELIDDPEAIVFVLIDEVESLTSARKSALNGTEPSDAIRVVNALLTQIDQIKKNSNVLILTTSNVTGAVDLAFVDRADIKQYIGPPSPAAVFTILHTCLKELMRTDIINSSQALLDFRALEVMKFIETDATRLSLRLRDISTKAYGLSGRTLRKLPFLAHALYVQTPSTSLEDFLIALEKTVKKQFEEREDLTKD